MSCPSCQSAASKLLWRASDRLFRTTNRRFDLRECQSCGVIFLSPTPQEAELEAYYPRGYWWQTAELRRRDDFWHGFLELYRRAMVCGHVRRIKRLAAKVGAQGAQLLDVGCGDGLVLAGCPELPLVRVGLDSSFDALLAAQRRGGLGLVQGSLKRMPFPDGSLNVVALFHVLEHVAEPILCLQEIYRVLAIDGWLAVQVPNVASLQHKLFGRRWAGFDVPRHLVNYSSKSLRTLLERNGFVVHRVAQFSLRDNPAMLVMSLFPSLYPPSRRLRSVRDERPPAWANGVLDVAYLFLTLLSFPFALGESLAGRGGTIFIEAQKR